MLNRVLIKIAKYTGYLLIVLFLLYFLSGYAMTKGIFDRKTARLIHDNLLPIPAFLCFLLHTFIYLRFNFREKLGKWSDYLFLFLGAVLLFGFFWFFLSP